MMEITIGGFFWLLFCIVVGTFASNRGRSGLGWFFLSLFISPLTSFIILLIIRNNQQNIENNKALEIVSRSREDNYNTKDEQIKQLLK